jgi:hypothetical protein
MCSDDIEHCLIARMALQVARCYYGVIYMTCAIIPWGRTYCQCSVDEVREFPIENRGNRLGVLPEASHDENATGLRLLTSSTSSSWNPGTVIRSFHMVK